MSSAKKQTTEQAIMNAATKLFVQKGFAATSTTEIAKEVGCNQAAVHYYYRTKDRLFESILETKFKFFVNKFLERGNEDLPFEERLTKKIETHFDLVKENSQIPIFLVSEIGRNPKRLETLKNTLSDFPREAITAFKKELDEEIIKGTIRKTDAFELLLTIISLNVTLFLVGPIFNVISGMDEAKFKRLVAKRKKEHVRIILASIKP